MDHPNRELERRARQRVNRKMGFYIHATVYLLVNLGLAGFSLHQGRQWFLAPLLGWGLGLAIHGFVVFAGLRGEGLRRRMVQRELERLRQHEAR